MFFLNYSKPPLEADLLDGKHKKIWSEEFFSDRQRKFVERFGLRVLTLGVMETREVVQARGNDWMAFPGVLLCNP